MTAIDQTNPTHESPQSFEDFWPYYVSQHRNVACRVCHFIGTTLAGFALAAAVLWSPWLLLLAPLAGYGMAWVGHFAFEKNKPASWFSVRHAVWSLRGDFRMWGLMFTRKMAHELAHGVDPNAQERQGLESLQGES